MDRKMQRYLLGILNKMLIQLQPAQVPTQITIKQSSAAGRGVFTLQNIPKSTIIAKGLYPIALSEVVKESFHTDYHELFPQIEAFKNEAKVESSKYEFMMYQILLQCCYESKKGLNNTQLLLNLLMSPDTDALLSSADAKMSLSVMTIRIKNKLLNIGLQKQVNDILGDGKDGADIQIVGRIWGSIALNCIKTPRGSALYGLPSFLNHSCKPNVGIHFDKYNLVSLVSLREIGKTEELSIHYCESDTEANQWSAEQQQQHLLYNYGINCKNCTTCK